MITISLENKEEAQVLINLLNLAVQAKGLEVAEAGIYFTRKIKEATEKLTSLPVIPSTETIKPE